MAWWCQQEAINWDNVNPDLCRHMASFGHSDLIDMPGDGLAKTDQGERFALGPLLLTWINFNPSID